MEDKKLQILIETILDKKSEDLIYIDVSQNNPLARFFIITTVTSNRHALAIGQALKEACEINDIPIRNVEGKSSSEWVLVDANDYIIHIFTKEARIHYGLEKLWANYPIVKVN